MIELRIQLRVDADTRIGPGKISLLEAIARAGSISAAARELEMTYRRAWELIDHMNKAFGQPLVVGHTGSAGGASLTALGSDVVRRFRLVEELARESAASHIAALDAAILTPGSVAASDADSQDDDLD
ncbi:LysR family transcriptional regulator [Pleomorphomonas diazotrophica]|uniref:LysR family transcriptional regulator n=1 Tax=Pleomorphomonas diazotrophica TaxID=1166257 RepID=A0A1I4QUL2_9HYPH|nr:LysR family transcriptional regulator [Pleomorphomonas diazotrophica]PKR90416.1 LysR family transcriptional regulator [Pleomorphomonas diazotrophica]SFM43754.1 molybdate transport system regulatory protein [Pleomorphomonas diazotrophica]